METKHFKITEEFLQEYSLIPRVIRMRMELERQGMKFEDSGKLSSMMNEEPKPLGKVVRWENLGDGSIHFKQII